MKLEIELESEQAQRLVEALEETFKELDNKIQHLKGRVRNLELRQKELIKAWADSHNA